jgi:hypothetical protein
MIADQISEGQINLTTMCSLLTLCQISGDETLDNKPILALSENALKLIYGNVEFQNFPGEDPASRGGKEGRVEERRGAGRVSEGDDEVGRGGGRKG